jgi:ectoine hydroxylase-related dioxygenase (phytanoyl-CoA dioxygenase family)
MWIPVDPVPRSSTLEFVAGSHRRAVVHAAHLPRRQAKWFPDGSLEELPDIDADRDRFRVLGWELEPGDMVCFHMLTLHTAGGVDGPDRRRVISLRFLGDDMVHAPREWADVAAVPRSRRRAARRRADGPSPTARPCRATSPSRRAADAPASS